MSSETFADEKVAGLGDEGAVDFGAEEQAEVAGVEGEEHLAAVGQGGDEDRFVFGGSRGRSPSTDKCSQTSKYSQ